MPRTRRGRGAGDPPHDGARTRRGRLRLDKLDPLLPGGKRMTPLPLRCLCSPRAATLCCTNLCARPLLCKHRHRRGLSLKPCVAFSFLFFCIWKREQCSILPYLCFYSGTNVGCVRVCFPVGFLKKWEEKKSPPFPRSFSPFPSFRHLMPPFFLFFVFVFFPSCFVLLRVHIPVCNPWFAPFSGFSKVSLCQLGSPPPPSLVEA